jgi:transposase-like protein
MFPDPEACAGYLEQLRWPSGFVCPECKESTTPWRHTRGRLVCSACRHHASATAGTILDKTRTPLTTWFEAAWHVTTAKNGLSAKTLERTLGTRYRVAWTLLQRFRVAMVRCERERLWGNVEVDETLVGGVEHGGKRGRGTAKSIVAIAVEVLDSKGFGRVRMRHIPDASGSNLMSFVCDAIAPGATVRTDGWGGYNDLPEHGRAPKDRVVLVRRSRPRLDAGRAPRCQPAEAMDSRDPPGLGHPRAPPVLLGRVYLQVQSAHIA